MTSSASDADLIVAARSGDAAAYGLLYERHSAAAYRLARQIVRTPADVDDVVAETFTRVLYAMKGGNGPAEVFRPYLLTAIRRVAIDAINGRRRQIPTDGADLPDPGEPFIDPMVTGLERSLITQAFLSLPERWSAVLWHTEVEQAKPAEVAAVLGLSANGVSVLRRRAVEGLKEAYLQLHLSDRADPACLPVAGKLGRYVRGRLSKRQVKEVEDHLSRCANCTLAGADLTVINDSLGGLLAPVVLGAAATSYLAAEPATGAATGAVPAGLGGARILHALRLAPRRVADLVTHHPATSVATAVAAASIAVPGAFFLHSPHAHVGVIAGPGFTRRASPGQGAGSSPARHPAKGTTPSAAPGAKATPSPSASASPKPSRSSSRSPRPTPSSPTTSPSRTSSASPTSSPTPTPTPTVSAKAKLSVSVQVSGLLNLGVTALVTVDVSDPGSAATGPVTAIITVPSGVTVLGLVGSSSWSCSATSGGLTCSRGAIGAGAASSLSFNILVVNLTGCGNSVLATATSGSLSASGASAAKVQCGL